ncbi:tetratricopeptide repeat protein [Mycobacterium sp. M26]|uniref:tetratricopeptide repeat protein n=1 Tax=Mycobacterium sp. M26 TaxID=1762962 RepID=UPI0012E3D011|nr:tetratricopeptide repeat protein [Mycobacterium sp. M26]
MAARCCRSNRRVRRRLTMTAVAEDVVETDVEADAPEVVVEEGRRTPWIRRALVAAFVAVLLGVSGWLGWQVWQQHRVQQASHDAQQAAVAYAQVLTSIDSAKVDQNFAEVLDGATGQFKDMYSQSSAQLRQLLVDNKATAHGTVVDSAVQSATPSTVVVLMFVDQTVSNSAAPDPRIDRSRVKMTMEKVDGQWRASKVELP